MNRSQVARTVVLAGLLVVGIVLVTSSFFMEWLETVLSVFEGRGSYDSQNVETHLDEVDDWWGLTYQLAVGALALLAACAAFGPTRARRPAGLAALAAGLVVGASLVAAWIDIMDARQAFVEKAEDLQAAAPNPGYVLSSTSVPGLLLATFGALAFLLAVLIALPSAQARAQVLHGADRAELGDEL
jgi:hypothetical protein